MNSWEEMKKALEDMRNRTNTPRYIFENVMLVINGLARSTQHNVFLHDVNYFANQISCNVLGGYINYGMKLIAPERSKSLMGYLNTTRIELIKERYEKMDFGESSKRLQIRLMLKQMIKADIGKIISEEFYPQFKSVSGKEVGDYNIEIIKDVGELLTKVLQTAYDAICKQEQLEELKIIQETTTCDNISALMLSGVMQFETHADLKR